MTGWIKIHRTMRGHWIFSNPEYLRAWVLILMEVNHAEKKKLISGKLLICGKGESLKSLDTWGTIFGNWSKNRVYRFFNLLKRDNMIELKNETVTTRLTVCNYCKYQSRENGSGTVTEQQAEQHTEQQAELDVERRRNTNKNGENVENGNNGKNDKKIKTISPRGKKPAKSGETWNAYCFSYQQRYGTEPLRTQSVNSILCRFVDTVGAAAAPGVAAYYLTCDTQWYITKGHDVQTMLGNAQKLHTEWQTGNRVSSHQAREMDRAQGDGDVWREIIEDQKEKEKLNGK